MVFKYEALIYINGNLECVSGEIEADNFDSACCKIRNLFDVVKFGADYEVYEA